MDSRDDRKKGFPHLLRPRDAASDPLANSGLLTVTGGGYDAVAEEPVTTPKEKSGPGLINGSTLAKNRPSGLDSDALSPDFSIDLSEEDKREIYDAIDVIRRKLSFARSFTQEERDHLMRLGKSGRRFVEKAGDLVQRSPGILPRSFDPDSFKRDAELYQELGDIADELKKLSEQVADMEAAIGTDAFTAALVVYQSGKLARMGDDMDNHLGGWRRRLNLE